jgi:hypothetical protein
MRVAGRYAAGRAFPPPGTTAPGQARASAASAEPTPRRGGHGHRGKAPDADPQTTANTYSFSEDLRKW